jgi:hypothetical protein
MAELLSASRGSAETTTSSARVIQMPVTSGIT